MKKWKYEIMAGTLLLLVSIRIYEIEIGTLVGLVCLIRGLKELYRQTGDQRFRYAWIAGFGTAMVRFTGTYEIGPWRWAGLLAQLFYLVMATLAVCAAARDDPEQEQKSKRFAVWQMLFLIYTAVCGFRSFVGDQASYAWMLSLVLLAGGVLLAVTLGILIRDCNVIRDVPAE